MAKKKAKERARSKKERKKAARKKTVSEEQALFHTVPEEKAFIFRLDNVPVATARNLRQLRNTIETIDGRAVQFHTRDGHFADWIASLGGEKLSQEVRDLANQDRPIGDLRNELLKLIDWTLRRAGKNS